MRITIFWYDRRWVKFHKPAAATFSVVDKPAARTSDRRQLTRYGCLDERIISTDALIDDVPSG
jgi:hypothetical protein